MQALDIGVRRGAALAAGAAVLLARPAAFGLPWSGALVATATLGVLTLSLSAVRTPADTAGPLRVLAVLGVGATGLLIAPVVSGPGLSVPAPVVAALALSVLAAIAEEALFRGVLWDVLAHRGVLLAGGISAVAFAVLHVPAYGLVALPVDLGAGILLSWQRWASGRWEVPAGTHAMANVLAVMR